MQKHLLFAIRGSCFFGTRRRRPDTAVSAGFGDTAKELSNAETLALLSERVALLGWPLSPIVVDAEEANRTRAERRSVARYRSLLARPLSALSSGQASRSPFSRTARPSVRHDARPVSRGLQEPLHTDTRGLQMAQKTSLNIRVQHALLGIA